MKKTAIILGSDSDLPVAEKSIDVFRKLGLPFTVHVISAHRTPEQARDFSLTAHANNYGVIIAIAGKAAHLAGVLASHTRLPVACMVIDGGVNVAWLAARTVKVNS